MIQPEHRKRATSDVLEGGAALAARNLLSFLRVTVPLNLPFGVLFGAVVVWLVNAKGSKHLAAWILAPVSLAYALAIVVAGAACLKVAAEVYVGGAPDGRAAIRLVIRRWASVLALSVLLLIGAAPAIAMIVLPGITALGNYALVLILAALFSLWLSGTFAAALPAMLLEEKRFRDSLGRSAALVRGSFFRALGTVVLGAILALFAGIVVAIVVSIFSLGGGNVIVIVSLVGVALGELFVAPLYVCFLVVLYYDLRLREQERDGADAGLTT